MIKQYQEQTSVVGKVKAYPNEETVGGLWRPAVKIGGIHVAEKCSDIALSDHGESKGWPFPLKGEGTGVEGFMYNRTQLRSHQAGM